MPATVPAGRDLRLDLFRGIGLWLIFLDHIPFNVVSWITIRNYGFSDAAEMFVFISGYTAGFVYGPAMRLGRSLAASSRLLKRAWQLYVTQVRPARPIAFLEGWAFKPGRGGEERG